MKSRRKSQKESRLWTGLSPEILREVERVLERKLSTLASEDYTSAGGIDAVVAILNNADRSTERNIIEALEEDDPDLAEEIKRENVRV